MPMRGVRGRSAGRAQWWRAAVALCVGQAAWLPCPPAHADAGAVIWQGEDQAVLLAPQDGEAPPPNDHPAAVPAPDIERMLSSLRLRRSDQEAEAPAIPVFNGEQVEILGAALAAGLGRATPSQDVTFSIIGAHRLAPDALVRRNRLTAGRAFVREGKLNVIFGELQSPYRKKNVYGRIEQDFHPREYGSRTVRAEAASVLIADGPASLREDTDGPRYDWVIFDPAAAAPAATAEDGDAEQRLRTLKRLRTEGLISEEAYRAKVDEILEEL